MPKMKAMGDNPRMNRFHRRVQELAAAEFPGLGYMLSTAEKQEHGGYEMWSTGMANEPDKTNAVWCEMTRQLNWAREQQTRAGLRFAPDSLRVADGVHEAQANLRLVKS